MKNLQPVINWFTERGGKYEGDSSPAFFDAESGSFSGEIEHTGNHEVRFCGLQIFLTEDIYETDEIKIVVQYLLEHGRNYDGDAVSIDDATCQHFGAGDDYACTRAHGNREGTAPPTSAAGAAASEFVPIRKSPTIRITTSATTIQVRQPRGLFLAPYESRGS